MSHQKYKQLRLLAVSEWSFKIHLSPEVKMELPQPRGDP
jgi:hypothetical protein